MSVSVIIAIASASRGGIIQQTLGQIEGLTDRPDAVWLCLPVDEADHALDGSLPGDVRVLTAPRGLCAQRNAILEAAPDNAVILFLDDDFLLGDGSVTALRQLFTDNADVVMATGQVIADGIGGPGLDHAEGARLLRGAPRGEQVNSNPTYNAYGCNMAVRADTAMRHGVRFDTDLPMYGWLEDVDFSRRMAAHGRILKCDGLFGVHLGTKKGRSRGVPLGYSQVANPIYLIRKGSMDPRRAYRLMIRNICANSGRALWPEPWIDRKGRLLGNLTALADLLRGRLTPTRVRNL